MFYFDSGSGSEHAVGSCCSMSLSSGESTSAVSDAEQPATENFSSHSVECKAEGSHQSSESKNPPTNKIWNNCDEREVDMSLNFPFQKISGGTAKLSNNFAAHELTKTAEVERQNQEKKQNGENLVSDKDQKNFVYTVAYHQDLNERINTFKSLTKSNPTIWNSNVDNRSFTEVKMTESGQVGDLNCEKEKTKNELDVIESSFKKKEMHKENNLYHNMVDRCVIRKNSNESNGTLQ